MKHKHNIIVLLAGILLVILLGGCGQNLEQKIAAVQEKNEITVQDVADLVQLEGLDIKKQTPSAEFAEKWPDTVIYKMAGENLLLMQSFAEDFWSRERTLNNIGWNGRGYWGLEDAAEVVKQAAADCQPESGQFLISKFYSGKNIVAWYAVYSAENVPNEEDMKTIAASSEIVERVFRADINGLKTEQLEKGGENYVTTAVLDYYRTPFTIGNATMYDFYMNVQFTVQLSDTFVEQYQGQEVTLEVEGLKGEGYYNSHMKASHQTKLDATTSTLSCSLGKWQKLIGAGYEEPYQFEVTVSAGDFSESMLIASDSDKKV